jgi:tRNA threonylcarbamoyladenosine biosynthesis protein TsaE
MPPACCFRSPAPELTRAAAAALAGVVGETCVLLLAGPLGAGKTVFVQGLAEGLGVAPGSVTSPTFAIATLHPLSGGRTLAHVDLYRIESELELEATGFPDLLAEGKVVAVEWGDRFPAALGPDRLELRLERTGDATVRRLEACATGPVSASVLLRWCEALREVAGLEWEQAS